MRPRQAFSLVEMTVALAILALVAVAALEVTTTLLRKERLDLRWQETALREAALRELLGRDLVQAARLRTTASGFELAGPLGLDRETLEVLHDQAVVSYELATADHGHCLLRRQTVEGEKPWQELAAWDVRALQARIVAPAGTGGPGARSADSQSGSAGGWKSIPAAAVVTVEWLDGGPATTVVGRRK